jgi:hypothetical protein
VLAPNDFDLDDIADRLATVIETGRPAALINAGVTPCASGSLPRIATDATLPWLVTDVAQRPIAPISEFLRDFVACGNSAASCRSYGYDLLRWWRFLAAVDVVWARAQRGEVRDFVLWLRTGQGPVVSRDMICAGLGCEELLIPEPETVAAATPTTGEASAVVGEARAVAPRARTGRSLPPR